MAVGKAVRGPLWGDGQFTVKVRGPGAEPSRTFRVRRSFALIGRIAGADLRIDDPAVDDRHAFLILDRRGLLGVDLLSRNGTRFAAETAAWSWLGPGDLIEVAGRRIEVIQLRVDGQVIDPPLSNENPFAEVHASSLPALTLEPLEAGSPPWMLGSSLAFVGRGDACVIRLDDDSVSTTHCALLRTATEAHVIDLLGRRTLVNDRDVEGACSLADGDVLTIGNVRFLIRLSPLQIHDITQGSSTQIEKFFDPESQISLIVSPSDPREALLSLLMDAADPTRDASNHRILEVLRQFQSDTATLFESQIERIEALSREISLLRDEVRGPRSSTIPPASPLRLDLATPNPATTDESASWLLDRLNTLETASRSTWKDLLGRIGSTVIPSRLAPSADQSLASTRPGSRENDRS